jgi:NTE family protein
MCWRASRGDTLVFQVDLWSARGELPTTLAEVAERQKDIQYSSRTRLVTDAMHAQQVQRRRLSELLALLPEALRNEPAARRAAELACDRRCNVIQLIYRDKAYEGDAKDYEFGQLTLQDHWRSGLDDLRHTLRHPQWLALPSAERPFVTHDVHRQGMA